MCLLYFVAGFLIDEVTVDQLELDGFSLEQLVRSYYVPLDIISLYNAFFHRIQIALLLLSNNLYLLSFNNSCKLILFVFFIIG